MKYDIVIIGGGPAGMMAAGRAGELGSQVVLLEKNDRLGVKLLMTGGGRCNFTNNSSARELANSFGDNGRWLLSAFARFGAEELMAFFNARGLMTKIEENNRVFPQSNSARDLLRILVEYLKSSSVAVRLSTEVKRIVKINNRIDRLILADGSEVSADKFIICTGGKSYPLSGSTGDAYKWLGQLGHKIVDPRPALVPVIVKDKFIKDLEGISLKEVEINCYQADKKFSSTTGPVIFTANGLSGPAILNMSEIIGRLGPKDTQIKIDFFPNLDFSQLDQKLREDFSSRNKMLKNSLDQLIPSRLADILIKLSNLDGRTKVNLVSREERKKLVSFLKEFTLTISGLAGYDQAMVTAGGVDLKEVDPKTMKSKIINNLYLAGEVLDLSGPTGGYNLQLSWTTGYLAGENASQNLYENINNT